MALSGYTPFVGHPDMELLEIETDVCTDNSCQSREEITTNGQLTQDFWVKDAETVRSHIESRKPSNTTSSHKKVLG